MPNLTLSNKTFNSRLILGTGKFSSRAQLKSTVQASGCDCVTMALKRVDLDELNDDDILEPLKQLDMHVLPNTSGARDADDAIFAAQLIREALHTSWIKLEIHPDQHHLLPDPVETLKAAGKLVEMGFKVLPYVHADPVLCRHLEDVGCVAVMPLGAPIGSNLGLRTRDFIEFIIQQSTVPVIVDAGIGCPSDAALAMEIGADAVMVNTAIATAKDPVLMARAFRMAVESGRLAFQAGLGAQNIQNIEPTSPLTTFLE